VNSPELPRFFRFPTLKKILKRAGSGSTNVTKVLQKSSLIHLKMDALQRIEAGAAQSDMGRSLGLTGFTIRTIIGNAKKIKTTAKSTNKHSQCPFLL
jgi:DNA-binding CsgD family transcriptional regulator